MSDELTPEALDRIEARANAAHDEVIRLCEPNSRWRMSIPADENRDSDIVLTASITDVPRLVAEVRRLRDAKNEYQHMWEACAEESTYDIDRAEAERDALRATLERVRHVLGREWAGKIHGNALNDLRAALNPHN